MKSKSLTVCFLIVGASSLAACAGVSGTQEDAESTESELSSWKKVVTCDNGAMVIDVKGYPMTPATGHDPDYAVQAVIRDRNIISYFKSTGAIAQGTNPNEAIVPGHIWLSTFGSSTFEGTFGTQIGSIQVDVRRFGNGAKIRFTEQVGRGCMSFCTNSSDPDYNPSSGVCEGCVPSDPHEVERANWWFGSCQTTADVHR